MKILVVDHEDSFTWNLVHELGELAECTPVCRDRRDVAQRALLAEGFDLLVLGPGPGNPEDPADGGPSLELLDSVLGRIPVFGVCFGMQLLGRALGGRVVPAIEIVHGQSLPVRHDGAGLFRGLPSPVPMMRYHSLVVERATLPRELRVSAESERGEIMAVTHERLPVWGVQFHPESVGSPDGRAVLRNVVELARAARTQ